MIGRPPRDVSERFWEKVDKSGGEDSCWLWMSKKNKAGYGNFWNCGGTRLAHKVAYELSFGKIPPKLCVCHRCDNPSCVNPAHFFLGTYVDNMNDAKKKNRLATGSKSGRHTHPERTARGKDHWMHLYPDKRPTGERHGMAKLTDCQVEEIRRLRKAGTLLKEIAEMFHTSIATVSKIGLSQTRCISANVGVVP